MNARGGENKPFEYPSYQVVEVNGFIDVIEHRGMVDIFYLCDDPAVWAALGVPYTKH
jgi:hypothetical protein